MESTPFEMSEVPVEEETPMVELPEELPSELQAPTFVQKPTLVQTYVDETTSAVKLGFTVATALAWNEAIKSLITKFVMTKDVPYYNTVFAIVITLIMITFMLLSKRMKRMTATKIE